jgi:hypothetical protein
VDRTAIYRKTERGVAEISTSQRTVDRRLRPLLILVDGHRSAARVLSLTAGIGLTEADVDELVSIGLIEAVPRPGQVGAAAAPATLSPAGAPTERGAFERFSDGQRYLCETASDRLGLMAFRIVLKFERCNNAEELLLLVPEFEAALARKVDSAFAQHSRRIAETLLHG